MCSVPKTQDPKLRRKNPGNEVNPVAGGVSELTPCEDTHQIPSQLVRLRAAQSWGSHFSSSSSSRTSTSDSPCEIARILSSPEQQNIREDRRTTRAPSWVSWTSSLRGS